LIKIYLVEFSLSDSKHSYYIFYQAGVEDNEQIVPEDHEQIVPDDDDLCHIYINIWAQFLVGSVVTKNCPGGLNFFRTGLILVPATSNN